MKLRIMTFNLRCDVKVDGVNYFPNRTGLIKQVILRESPDIIGFQEATDNNRRWLLDNLSDEYVVIGCGRDAIYRGEANCIAFKKHDFELISFETKQLSMEPDVPGTRFTCFEQSINPRIFCRATLSHKDAPGEPIHVFNTHLDDLSHMARVMGMAQVLQSVAGCQGKFVLTGDMNARPDEKPATMPLELTNKKVVNATEHITHSFHGWGKYTEDYKIDYIYTDATVCGAYAVNDGPVDGVWISDHYPICADIEF